MDKFEKGQKVFIFNREIQKHELGEVLSRYKREKVYRYDVKLERGIVLEYVSTNPESIFFINSDMTNKFNQRINAIA
jgi:hypothetical protein